MTWAYNQSIREF